MRVALWLWRQYPTEIEADLLQRGVDIADWHCGARDERGWLKLSSRRLLALMEHLPERSAYKTALREGDWPEDTQILAKIHDGLAEFHAGHREDGNREYQVFLSPIERRKHFEEAMAEAEEDSGALDAIYSQIGFS